MKIALYIDAKLFIIEHIEKMIIEEEKSCGPSANSTALKGALTCVTNTPTVEKMKNDPFFVSKIKEV